MRFCERLVIFMIVFNALFAIGCGNFKYIAVVMVVSIGAYQVLKWNHKRENKTIGTSSII